jgi:hypothetical protein
LFVVEDTPSLEEVEDQRQLPVAVDANLAIVLVIQSLIVVGLGFAVGASFPGGAPGPVLIGRGASSS